MDCIPSWNAVGERIDRWVQGCDLSQGVMLHLGAAGGWILCWVRVAQLPAGAGERSKELSVLGKMGFGNRQGLCRALWLTAAD